MWEILINKLNIQPVRSLLRDYCDHQLDLRVDLLADGLQVGLDAVVGDALQRISHKMFFKINKYLNSNLWNWKRDLDAHPRALLLHRPKIK